MAAGGARPGLPQWPVPRSSPCHLPVPGDLFVGRSEELAALQELLVDPSGRLVTLTGPPGIGKTRLAIAAVSRLVGDSRREAVLVELADIREPAAVVTALAGALGVDGPGPLSSANWLADVELPAVLLLDNFEHLLPAASALGSLLDACPELRVLVTSRERLRLTAEREFPVPPLAVPSPADVADLSAVAANPCVALLVDRARRVRPQFALTAANA